MIYIMFGIIIIAIICILYLLFDIQMELCSIFARTERTYDIVNKWAIYYVCEEWNKGNTKPIDFIFPNDREEIEEQMRQEECHIDNEKE